MRPRHWFHCTTDDHGPQLGVRRQVPLETDVREPPVPRLCVCPTVAACLGERLFLPRKSITVYRTPVPRRAIKPRGVWSQVVSGERWLIPPAALERFAAIDPDAYEPLVCSTRLYHWHTRKGSSLRLRAAMYARVVAGLDPELVTARDRRLARVFRDHFGIADPDDFILAAAG